MSKNVALPFAALVICLFTATAVPQGTSQSQTQTKTTTTPPKGDTKWIPVAATDWMSRSAALIGKSVELSGRLETMMLIDPKSDFSNTGYMRGADRAVLAIVLFDQIGPDEISWMAQNRCMDGCDGVFVRGTVVKPPHQPKPVLRMSEISFDSHAGVAPASIASVADVAGSAPPASKKQLLPSGGAPKKEGKEAGAIVLPTGAPSDNKNKSVWDQMKTHSDEMRQSDYNMDRAIVPGPDRKDDFETYYRSIRDTKLNNVFAKYPWNTGRNSWPRVVIIVEEKPEGGSLLYMKPGDAVDDRCWRLSAKLWTGPAASEDIETFNWCLSEMRYNVPYSDVALWGQTPKSSMLDKTSAEPTLGPNPPYVPAPKYQYRDGANFDTIMLGNILLDMHFSFGVPDGRVWIVDKDMVRAKH